MLLPIRSKNPPESLPIGTILLILINVAVYIGTSNGLQISKTALEKGGLTYHNFSFLTVLSSMFLHGDILHLLGNMWFLYLFGFAVEGRLRTWRFMPLYLLSGVAGDALQTLLLGQAQPDLPSIGASGAIMGVLGAALYLFPHGQIDFFYWIRFNVGTFTWPMWGVALMYLGLDLLFGFIGLGMKEAGGVAHFAHIGGAVGGVLICALFRPKRDTEEISLAKATLAETKDLSLLSPMELSEMHRVNPTDSAIVLNWMHRTLATGRQVDKHLHDTFMRMLPQIMSEHEVGPVGYCMAWMSSSPGAVHARYLLQVGGKLEARGDGQTALRLYDAVLKDPSATPGDLESALFRMGMVYEAMLGDRDRAAYCYNQVVEHWPMSPMADQARARLRVIAPVRT